MRFLNKKDILLMTFFRNNARENLTRISRATNIPVSTIFDKLKNYEDTVIQKHTTLIDFKKLGFDIKVNMLLRVAKETKEEFKIFLIKHKNINSVFRTNNGYDFIIEAVFRDMKDLQDFMESIDKYNVLEKQEMFILDDYKREGFLADRLDAELLFLQKS